MLGFFFTDMSETDTWIPAAESENNPEQNHRQQITWQHQQSRELEANTQTYITQAPDDAAWGSSKNKALFWFLIYGFQIDVKMFLLILRL